MRVWIAGFCPCTCELRRSDSSIRFEESKLAEAELVLFLQISKLKRQHIHQRNSRQPICRLPAELLVKLLSSLTAKDQLSIMRVSQHLREHVIGTPSLWTHVDRIQKPVALSFVLGCAKGSAVDIASVYVTGLDDTLFEALAAHMYHIRTLCLHVDWSPSPLLTHSQTRAYSAFTKAAPLLERLSMRTQRSAASSDLVQISCYFMISASNMPRLSSLHLHGVDLDTNLFRKLHSLSTFSFSGHEGTRFLGPAVPEFVSRLLRNLTTINLELSGWTPDANSPGFGPALQKVNIRWIKPGFFIPQEAIPNRDGWSSIRVIHIAHMPNDYHDPWAEAPAQAAFAIPETTAPYRALTVRTSGLLDDTRVHTRLIDSEDRERVFCGIHPTMAAGLVAHISGQELSSITIGTTAVSLGVLSNARCPTLCCLRLVMDPDGITWFNVFARDILGITTLERLEFSMNASVTTTGWSTAMTTCVLASCAAAGNNIQEAIFLGFEPEAQCVASAQMFAQTVVVHRERREPESERVWFTEPPFDWF